MSEPRRLLGVDCSGATDARDRVWVADCRLDGDRIAVRDCAPAREALVPSGADPEATTAALADRIRAAPGGTVVGMDAPFGLPAAVAAGALDATDWRESLDAVAALEGPEALATACVEWANGRDGATYRRRRTDEAIGGLSPYHFFVVNQTYHVVAGVLRPLVRAGVAAVLPNDLPAPADRPWLLEVYPAGVFAALDCHDDRYKGDDEAERRRRAANLDGLRAAGARLDDGLATRLVEDAGGDGLDALAAAVGAARVVREDRLEPPADAWLPVESHSYV